MRRRGRLWVALTGGGALFMMAGGMLAARGAAAHGGLLFALGLLGLVAGLGVRLGAAGSAEALPLRPAGAARVRSEGRPLLRAGAALAACACLLFAGVAGALRYTTHTRLAARLVAFELALAGKGAVRLVEGVATVSPASLAEGPLAFARGAEGGAVELHLSPFVLRSDDGREIAVPATLQSLIGSRDDADDALAVHAGDRVTVWGRLADGDAPAFAGPVTVYRGTLAAWTADERGGYDAMDRLTRPWWLGLVAGLAGLGLLVRRHSARMPQVPVA